MFVWSESQPSTRPEFRAGSPIYQIMLALALAKPPDFGVGGALEGIEIKFAVVGGAAVLDAERIKAARAKRLRHLPPLSWGAGLGGAVKLGCAKGISTILCLKGKGYELAVD
jgi:hypothetical protein